MARFTTTIRSPWSAEQAFDYMADFRNFEDWDPGVSASSLVAGDEPGPGAAYSVKVTGTTLRYETREFDRPRRTVVEAISPRLRSYDIVEVHPRDDGCDVTYDATLELNGFLKKIADPIMGIVFRRIGNKAAAGMAEKLEGQRIV